MGRCGNEPETRPCLLCKKQMECAATSWDSLQPVGGGEVRFIFSYGSRRFDEFSGETQFEAVICDKCASKYVSRMRKIGYGFDGDVEHED